MACGIGEVLNNKKVTSHLKAIHRYNLKVSLAEHANPPSARRSPRATTAACCCVPGRRAGR